MLTVLLLVFSLSKFDLIAVNDLVANHLSRILHSESHNVVISSAM